jgi:hypothetical protein
MKVGKDGRYLISEFNKNRVDKIMKYKRIMASGPLKPAQEVYP